MKKYFCLLLSTAIFLCSMSVNSLASDNVKSKELLQSKAAGIKPAA